MKDIYKSKSGNIVQPDKHALNHKLFHIYNYAKITKGSVQEDDGPLRCNPSFQKQHHATKKYINPSLT